MNPPVDWLLEGEAYIVYRTRRDLLGEDEACPEVREARESMMASPLVQKVIGELSVWPWTVISSHKSAGQPFHKLTFIADLGVNAEDSGMNAIIQHLLEHQSAEGPFQLPINVPTHFGGTGKDQWAWALCDTPLLLYALAKFGLEGNPQVKAASISLANLARDNGWPCAVSKALGKFRGPGRKEDPCPFATLAMLKAFAELEEYKDSSACHQGARALLNLWENSLTEHPYIFYMGSDFRKLKVPFIWYDLIHVLDVLSRFPWLREDPRLLDMVGVMKSKMDAQGRFTVESAWAAWKDWEFGQKKIPSRWLTLLAWRIIDRLEWHGI